MGGKRGEGHFQNLGSLVLNEDMDLGWEIRRGPLKKNGSCEEKRKRPRKGLNVSTFTLLKRKSSKTLGKKDPFTGATTTEETVEEKGWDLPAGR